MNKIFTLLLCAVLLIGCSAKSSSSDLLGKFAPGTRVQMLDGEYLPLEAYKGQTLVVMFWATWCSKSSQSLSELGRLAAELQARQNLEFLAVSVDKAEDIEKVRTRVLDEALRHLSIAYSGNAEYDEAYLSFRCGDIPQFFVIDPRGVIVAHGRDIASIRAAIR